MSDQPKRVPERTGTVRSEAELIAAASPAVGGAVLGIQFVRRRLSEEIRGAWSGGDAATADRLSKLRDDLARLAAGLLQRDGVAP